MEEKIEIGRVTGRTFKALGANFPLHFAASVLLAGVPGAVIQYLIMDNMLESGDLGFFTPLYWAGTLTSALLGYLLYGFLTRSTVHYLRGEGAGFGDSLLATFKAALLLMALGLMSSLIIGIGLLLLVVPGVIAYVVLMPSVAILMEERRGLVETFERSRALTRGSRARIFLIVALFWLGAWGISMLTAGLFAAAQSSTALMDPTLTAIQAGLNSTLNTMIVGVAGATLYAELREVKEGAAADSLAEIFA